MYRTTNVIEIKTVGGILPRRIIVELEANLTKWMYMSPAGPPVRGCCEPLELALQPVRIKAIRNFLIIEVEETNFAKLYQSLGIHKALLRDTRKRED